MLTIYDVLNKLYLRQLKVVSFFGFQSGKITIPGDVNYVLVTGVAGGAGNLPDSPTSAYSSGAGAGEYTYREKLIVVPGESLDFACGKGGFYSREINQLIPATPTQIFRNGTLIFDLRPGLPNTYVDNVFFGGFPGKSSSRLTSYSSGGNYGQNAINSFLPNRRGRGGSNPLGGSAQFPNFSGVNAAYSTPYGYGYGAGGSSIRFDEPFNNQGTGGDGALVIEYLTSNQ